MDPFTLIDNTIVHPSGKWMLHSCFIDLYDGSTSINNLLGLVQTSFFQEDIGIAANAVAYDATVQRMSEKRTRKEGDPITNPSEHVYIFDGNLAIYVENDHEPWEAANRTTIIPSGISPDWPMRVITGKLFIAAPITKTLEEVFSEVVLGKRQTQETVVERIRALQLGYQKLYRP